MINNFMKNYYKINGYSLIELLATIAIISIVIVLIFFSINSSIINSNKNIDKITNENIADAAILYTKEYYSEINGWHFEYNTDGSINENSMYYCLSVQELINKGYFNEDILKNNINTTSYIKVFKDNKNKTYVTKDLFLQDNNICKDYIVTFVDRYNNPIIINNNIQTKVVISGYSLKKEDFPITLNTTYYEYSEGNSNFFHNEKWENENGNLINPGYEIKNDTIVKIKYSLKSGIGTAYLLSKGQQRPFDGEGDSSSRYSPLSGNGGIELTDDGGTSLADFVQHCHNINSANNCVLSLNANTFNNYLSTKTKNLLTEKEAGRNIEWYVLKYVNGTWHLDGQEYTPISIGFINPTDIKEDTAKDKNSCLYWNNNCKLSFTIYDSNIEIINIKITNNNSTTFTYDNYSLIKLKEKTNIFSNGYGYYLNNPITVTNLKCVTIQYKVGEINFEATYNYNHNNGTYIFNITK